MTFVKQAPLFPEQDLQPQQPSETVNSRADSPEQAFDADPVEHEPDPDAEDSPYTRLAPPVAVDSESAPVVDKQHAQVGTATDADADAELAMAAELSPYTLLSPNHPAVGTPERPPDVFAALPVRLVEPDGRDDAAMAALPRVAERRPGGAALGAEMLGVPRVITGIACATGKRPFTLSADTQS